MFFFDSSSNRDVRDRQDGEDKSLHGPDEKAEQRPGRPGQPRHPARDQHDDQGQQKLADKNVEVEPERERDWLGKLIDDREWKVRRYEEQVLEITAEMSAANAVALHQHEGHQGEAERRVPVVG